MMDDVTQTKIAEGLRQAIQAEEDGYHFFRMAANNTTDDKGREVFLAMADEELEHKRFLEKQFEHLETTGTFDATLRLTEKVDLSGDHPIFSANLKDRVEDAHFEMSALSIGVQLELNSRRFYERQAALSDDPNVKSFFEELAEWEGRHYTALTRQQDILKQDFWGDAGFSPF